MPRKPRRINIRLLRSRILRKIRGKGLSFAEGAKLRSRIIVEHVLERQPFFERIDPKKRDQIKSLVLQFFDALVEQNVATEELWQQYEKGEISKPQYFSKMSEHPAAFEVYLIFENIKEFFQKNGIPYIHWDSFRSQMALTARKVLLGEELGY